MWKEKTFQKKNLQPYGESIKITYIHTYIQTCYFFEENSLKMIYYWHNICIPLDVVTAKTTPNHDEHYFCVINYPDSRFILYELISIIIVNIVVDLGGGKMQLPRAANFGGRKILASKKCFNIICQNTKNKYEK